MSAIRCAHSETIQQSDSQGHIDMQVSQMSDSVTNAIIGQEEQISMGVDDSAALMHILSNTLYTHPMLAMVREIMCNGWDAHIQSKITHRPLEVEITSEYFSVRDFGNGIPHEAIGAIYGKYGRSTKTNDSESTGGFGLGSKAPFAYTDNFEVVSCCDGVKTIYRVSKSSMEVGGKPSINKILSLPTEETGITVKVMLKDRSDASDIENLVEEVVFFGEIKTLINGENNHRTLPLSSSPTGYVLYTDFEGTNQNHINIRYGNVVYPIPRHDAYAEKYKDILRKINYMHDSPNVVFMAEPNSISIAPTRENIILTPQTVETVKSLLDKLVLDDIEYGESAAIQVHKSQIKKEIKPFELQPAKLLSSISDDKPLVISSKFRHEANYAFNLKSASMHSEIRRLGYEISSHACVVDRLKVLAKSTLPSRDIKIIKEMIKYARVREEENHSFRRAKSGTDRLFQKNFNWPVIKVVKDHPKLSAKRLSVPHRNYRWAAPDLVPTKDLYVGRLDDLVSYLGRNILICPSKVAAREFFNNKRQLKGWFVYTCTQHVENIKEAVKAFTNAGFNVTVHKIEKPEVSKELAEFVGPPKPKKATPKRKGYLTLRSSYNYDDSTYQVTHARKNCKTEDHVVDPVAYVVLNTKHMSKRFGGFNAEEAGTINKLWGKEVAVVLSTQVSLMQAKGIPELSKYVYSYVDEELSTNKEFPRWLAFGHHLETDNSPHAKFLSRLTHHEEVMKELGLRFSVSAKTAMLIRFWEGLDYHDEKSMPKATALAAKIKESPMRLKLLKKIENSAWGKYVNFNQINFALSAYMPGNPALEIPYTIVRNIMK